MQETSDISSFESVGILAGQIWHYLNSNGKTSVVKLKSELLSTATYTHLALGWLLREGKIEFLTESGDLIVQLKK